MFITLLLLPFESFAQGDVYLKLFTGFANYSGDLQEKRFTSQQSHFAGGIGVGYRVLPKVVVNSNLTLGRLSAHDRHSSKQLNRDRNLNFYTDIVEISLSGEYELFHPEYSMFTPFVTAGVAVFHFNPHAEGVRNLREFRTEGQGFIAGRETYSTTAVALPFGGGLRLRLADNIYLGWETVVRKTFTDYIDDVSTTYADRQVLLQNRGQRAVDVAFRTDELYPDVPYPPAGTVRGSPKSKDWYYFSGFTLVFRFMNSRGSVFNSSQDRGSIACPRIY